MFFTDSGETRNATWAGLSTPFAQAVAGRVVAIKVTPLNTSASQRQYSVTYALTESHGPTEIVVPADWAPADKFKVDAGHGDVVNIEKIPGAQLSKVLAYKSSARVRITHAKRDKTSPQMVTISIR